MLVYESSRMEKRSSTGPVHFNTPSLPSLHSGSSTPYKDLDMLQDNYYRQFIEGIELEKERAYSPTNLSVVSTSTSLSYAQPQGLRDSLFKPIREVLADHRADSHPTYKCDTTGENIQSEAMIEALRALQSKIARLEMERAAAAEKFESLSSRTSQNLLDRPVLTNNILEAPTTSGGRSELRNVSHTSVVQPQGVSNFEAERRLDSINEKCWYQAQELETTREMLRRAELDRKSTEEQMSRLERKYEDLRANSEILGPQFQLETELLAKKASEDAVRKVVERQREMASSQEQTENKVRELQHELKLERHRRKLLQEKAAELQARQDSSLSLSHATSLATCPHVRSRVKKKKAAGNKLVKHKHASNPRSHGSEHYRVQLKDIPFVVGTSTTQSHSVGGNYQQLIALLKSHNTAVCGRGPHGAEGKEGNTRRKDPPPECMPKEDSKRLIEELERELATLQISHQHLARELQLSQDSPSKDSESIERALIQLLDQMDVKAQHVRLAKTVSKQVHSKRKDSVQSNAPLPHSDTPAPSNSPPVNLYSNAPLPSSNITALRVMRNIQNTLKVEDLHWN